MRMSNADWVAPVLWHGMAPLYFRVTSAALKAWKQSHSEKMHAA